MKRLLPLSILLLFGSSIAYSQNAQQTNAYQKRIATMQRNLERMQNPGSYSTTATEQSLPTSSTMSKADAHDWITTFQNNNDFHYPSSYLMKADKLTAYLSAASAPYIQVYLAYDQGGSKMDLVFVGLKQSNGTDKYEHQYYSNYVLGNTTPFPYAGTVYDANLDGPDKQQNPGHVLAVDSKITVSDAHDRISYYQTSLDDYSESFMLKADQLKTFLTGTHVPYIQIYLATTPSGNLTLIFVGVDSAGNHVYHQSNMVFEEVVPCPVCAFLTFDSNLDYHHQESN